MNKKYLVQYKYGNEIITSTEKENDFYRLEIENVDNRYTVTLVPKKSFEMVDFYAEMPFGFIKGDKFFGAGYQSWTKTKEWTADEIMPGTTKLANISEYTKDVARKTSDEWMVNYSYIPGEFHSHCYTYIKRGDNIKLWGSLSEKTGYTIFKVNYCKRCFFVIH